MEERPFTIVSPLRWPVAFGLIASLLVIASSIHPAVASERVMIVVEEQLDGRREANPVAEVRLTERLIEGGQQVVEAVETERARRTISVDKLLHGVVGDEVSALNCDILIVGRTNSINEEIPYGVQDVAAVTSEWTVRAVAVDTARVLVSASGRATGAGTQARAASASARQKAADAMFDAISKAFSGPAAPAGSVSLSISDLQELSDVGVIRDRLMAIDGVDEVSVRFVSGDETRIELATSLDTWGLATALKSVGLEVAQLSRGAVSAKWAPWGAGRSLLIGSFVNETGIDRHDWIESMLPEVFATELANSNYLRAADSGAAIDLPDDSPATIARAAKAAQADLLTLGALERVGPQLRLSVTAYGADGRTVTAAQVFSPEAELVQRTRDLVWALDQRLFERLFAKGSLTAYKPVYGGRAPSARPERSGDAGEAHQARATVRVTEVALDDLFPSRLAAYAKQPVGRIALSNQGGRTATGIRIRVDIPGITSAPAVLKVADLPPGGSLEVPVTLVLDRERVQAIGENTPAQAEVALSWKDAGQAEGNDLFTVPLVVFEKNSLDWSEPQAIAAFTTHRDPSLDALARAAQEKVRGRLEAVPELLHVPLALYEALAASGIRYQADARNPFGVTHLDAVAFPAETLARKAGDCDDLSVLMAALLESQGVSTAFLLTPGHILVAWDSGVAIADAKRLGLPDSVPIDRDGRAWVPIEVTRLGAPFTTAIMAGSAEIQRHAHDPAQLKFVDVADAWQRFPPFPARFAKVTPALSGLATRLAASAEAFANLSADRELAHAPKPHETADAAELNRIGVRLVERGQWRTAVDYLERAAELGSNDHQIRYNLGSLRVVQGKRAEARAIYQALREIPEVSAASLHGLGVVEYLDGSTKEARALFERSRLPEAKEALVRLGLTSPPPRPRARPRRTRKPVAPPPDPFLGIRAGVERVPIDELLVWLR